MMYFQGNSFYPFALDWQEQSNGRQVIPGLGIYFLHPDEGSGHAMKWIVRLISSVIRKWQEKAITVSSI